MKKPSKKKPATKKQKRIPVWVVIQPKCAPVVLYRKATAEASQFMIKYLGGKAEIKKGVLIL